MFAVKPLVTAGGLNTAQQCLTKWVQLANDQMHKSMLNIQMLQKKISNSALNRTLQQQNTIFNHFQ
jgi:hypothetical protein